MFEKNSQLRGCSYNELIRTSLKNPIGVLLVVLTLLYAPFGRSFATKRNFCLPKAPFCYPLRKQWHIIAVRRISSPKVHIISRRLYRFRNDDIQTFGLMIYRNELRRRYAAQRAPQVARLPLPASPT